MLASSLNGSVSKWSAHVSSVAPDASRNLYNWCITRQKKFVVDISTITLGQNRNWISTPIDLQWGLNHPYPIIINIKLYETPELPTVQYRKISITWVNDSCIYHLVKVYIMNWKDPPFSMGKSTISMAIFQYVTNYQRVSHILSYLTPITATKIRDFPWFPMGKHRPPEPQAPVMDTTSTNCSATPPKFGERKNNRKIQATKPKMSHNNITYIYIYIWYLMYIYIYVYICIWLCLCVCICICICICVYVYVYMYMYMCMYMCIYIYRYLMYVCI